MVIESIPSLIRAAVSGIFVAQGMSLCRIHKYIQSDMDGLFSLLQHFYCKGFY